MSSDRDGCSVNPDDLDPRGSSHLGCPGSGNSTFYELYLKVVCVLSQLAAQLGQLRLRGSIGQLGVEDLQRVLNACHLSSRQLETMAQQTREKV